MSTSVEMVETSPACSTPDGWAEPSFPLLPPPPGGIGVFGVLSHTSRTAFRYANRYAMVPFHRAGLAA